MKRTPFTLIIAAAAALLASTPNSRADFGLPSIVTPADTFNIAVTGFNTAGTSGIFLTPAITATFGSTQTFAGSGPTLGQTITVTSNETVGATTTTDTITISVPTNFDPAGTTVDTAGDPVQAIELEMGRNNAGTNTLDFLLPITSPVYSGSVIYSGGTLALNATANALLTNGNRSFSDIEGVNAGGADLSTFTVRSFTLGITYSNVIPEPSTWAMCGVGLVGCAGVVFRRRRLAP